MKPRLILEAFAPSPIEELPRGTQPMLDTERATEIASLQQLLVSYDLRASLARQYLSPAPSAKIEADLKALRKIATQRLTELLNSYGDING